MAILADMKAFFRFVEEASDDELMARFERAKDMVATKIATDEGKEDANYLLRIMEQELIARHLLR